MAKDKNLINKLMGTQAISDDEGMNYNTEEEETEEVAAQPQGQSEDWLSEYEGQLTIDMYQTKDNVIIKSTIAGVRPEDIDVTIANDMVTIRGERKKDFEASSEDYFYQECYWGSFSRSVVLPVDVDIENVSADLKDGILTVILPKAAKAKAKKIRVGAKE
ncbi:MAG: Hsp20/alpha crystallin family protein [Candidatus Doudnabacteria bacterium]|nr:Hsp20/alpha crystallin family protein [Candidatus Doudnabacteria bacterium]